MEHTHKQTVSTDEVLENREKEVFNVTPSEAAFFRQMEKSLKKYTVNMNAPKPLESLYENIHRLNRLFIMFGYPWIADCGRIQNACAWYLAYAKPTEEEARNLIETLNGFTSSVCYLSEWKGIIRRMQEFLCVQEKELKRLFEYEKVCEQKHRVRGECLSAEGATFCMTIGGGEIYGVLYSQVEELHRVMGRFIEREKAPFECKVKGYDDYCVSISKNIELHAEKDEFYVSYSLDFFEPDSGCVSAGQMQRVADSISGFLKVFGENGEKKVRWDMADYPEEKRSDVAFEIKEDKRLPVFRTVPWVRKRINKEEDEDTEIEYFIDVNEIHSPELSFSEFVAVYRKLGEFLKKPDGVQPG